MSAEVRRVRGEVREEEGLAGSMPALRVLGLGAGLEAGITTATRNFRWRDRHDGSEVARAYAELDDYASRFGGWLRVRQVHGARVVDADAARSHGHETEVAADGIVRELERYPTLPALLTITVADCVPVFLAWEGGYALLHAGWRGAAAGVLEEALSLTGGPRNAGDAPGTSTAAAATRWVPRVVPLFAGNTIRANAAPLARSISAVRRDEVIAFVDSRRARGPCARRGVPTRHQRSACAPRATTFSFLRRSGDGRSAGISPSSEPDDADARASAWRRTLARAWVGVEYSRVGCSPPAFLFWSPSLAFQHAHEARAGALVAETVRAAAPTRRV